MAPLRVGIYDLFWRNHGKSPDPSITFYQPDPLTHGFEWVDDCDDPARVDVVMTTCKIDRRVAHSAHPRPSSPPNTDLPSVPSVTHERTRRLTQTRHLLLARIAYSLRPGRGNFSELRQREVQLLRIPLLETWVNKALLG